MRTLLAVAIMLLTTLALSPVAKAWDVEEMNARIEAVNFLVGTGCSGTLIGDVKQRVILTNYHCIAGQVRSEMRKITMPDGTIKEVKREKLIDVAVSQHVYKSFERVGTTAYVSVIVAHDKRHDLALLQLKADKIPQTQAAPLLPDGVEVLRGERVYSVGNPAGFDATVGVGIVSSTTRQFEFSWTDGEKNSMIQHSAGTIGGNSGGSLFNDYGFVVGVPSAALRGAPHIGLAVPVSTVKEFLRKNCFESLFVVGADDAACREKKIQKTTAKADKE